MFTLTIQTSTRTIGLLALLLAFAFPARGQVVLTLANPVTDSFPLVSIDVNVTQNGAPAQLISGTNFTVREDGIPGNVIGLTGCGGTSSVAVALVVDTSASMQFSLGSGPVKNRSYAMFEEAVSNFIASIPGPSLLALVPFADTSARWYPDSINTFYTTNHQADTTALMWHLGALKYIGANTDVVSGIAEGARVLQTSPLPRHIMILVTDDAVSNADSVQMFLNALGIRLFILDVSRDSTETDYVDHDLAIGTGGGYYHAYDTTLYAPMLLAISQLIFAEHCTLQYRSSLVCPAWNIHRVTVTLNYKGTVTSANISYSMDRVPHDSIPPRLSLDTPSFISRVFRAYETFPCESGMQSLLDSSSQNFTILPRVRTADSMSDSLVAIDSLYPADTWMLAIDSAGNISRKPIHYQPKPDTHPPQFDVPMRTGALYSEDIHEMLPWDRGIDTIYLASGAVNLTLDSIRFTNKNLARAFLHILDARDSAMGCLIAGDSAGNRDTACIEWDGEGTDTLPPVIVQSAIAEPRVALTGTVTEERLYDRGIRRVVVTPLVNTSTPQIIYDSAQQARVSVVLSDSLYPGSALIEATDSAGNFARDTFEYAPLPDVHPPLCTYTPIGKSEFVFYATDTQAWDRGIAYMLLLGSTTNAAAAPAQFLDGHRATLTVNVADRTLPATIVVQVTDSAGHQTAVRVNFAGIPLIPLGDSVIDFGTVIAPASLTRTIVLTNQNDIPVSLDLAALQGDDSVFQIVTPSPVLFPAFGTEAISFAFHPSLIGSYKATSTIMHHIGVGSVTLLGRSIGTLSLSLDTSSVQAGDTGSLQLSIESSPKPTNLDTIGFTLTYDPDMVSFADIPSCPNGALDTGLCIYNAYWSGGVAGNRQAILVRNNPDAGATLSFGRTSLTLPFQTYVSARDTTIVHITPLNTASAKILSTQDGLVIERNNCGDPPLRSMMTGGDVGFKILSVNPNPANTSIELHIQNDEEMDACVAFIALDGAMVTSLPVHLLNGVQKLPISNLPDVSGTFEIVVSANGRALDRTRIEMVR